MATEQTPIETYKDAHDIGKEFYRLRQDLINKNAGRLYLITNLKRNYIVVTQTYKNVPEGIEKKQYYIQLSGNTANATSTIGITNTTIEILN